MTNTPHNPLENPTKPEMVIDLHDGSNEQVSIVVVHHEKPEYLNICLQSIHIMSHLNNYEVIVVDNGSSKTTQDYLDSIEDEGIKVIRNKENRNWSVAANQGAAAADKNSKYLIFIHCDTVVLDQAWIDLLINISESNDSGLVGTQMHSYLIQKQKINFVSEWCMLMSRECWEDCGPWPEELPILGHSFILTLRATVKGYKPQVITNKLMHHYQAFSYDPHEWEKITQEAMAIIPKLMQQARS